MTEAWAPFDVTLRRAVTARGLTLDRLAERLAAAGTPVSVSTLSNWQRGRTIPSTPASQEAVTRLESILGLPAGGLTGTLAAYRTADRTLPVRVGLAEPAATRLWAEFGLADPGLATVRLDEHVRVSPGEVEVTSSRTVRAERSGVDRFVATEHSDDGVEPGIEAGSTCTIGSLRHDDESGLFGIELLFDAPLTRGELYPVSYRLTGTAVDDYRGNWLQPGVAYYGLSVEFETDVRPAQVYRVWRNSPHSTHTRMADLRLIHGRFAHLWLTDPAAGFHGIRWVTRTGH